VDRYDPDLWTDEFAFLNQPARPTSKATSSTTTHERRRLPQVASLDAREAASAFVLWGKHTCLLSFRNRRPIARRAEGRGHVLDAGHFALDTAADQIAQIVGASWKKVGSRNAKVEYVDGAQERAMRRLDRLHAIFLARQIKVDWLNKTKPNEAQLL